MALRYLHETGGGVVAGGVTTILRLVRGRITSDVDRRTYLFLQGRGGNVPAADVVPTGTLQS